MSGAGPAVTAEAARAVRRIATGYWAAGVLYVLARFGIADHLAAGPRDAAGLAEKAGLRAEVLARFLRAGIAVGVLEDAGAGAYRLSELGQALRGDVAGSVRDNVVSVLRWQREAWRHDALEAALAGPGPGGFAGVHGRRFFDWLGEHPDEMAIFQRGMTARHAAEPVAFVAAWEFGRYRTVMDLGGGAGALLEAVLAAAPGADGVLLDLPDAVARAPTHPRIRRIAHDFFKPLPARAGLILLKRVLHDWDDAEALRILANARAALEPDGRIVLLDGVLEDGAGADPLALLDLHMLLLVGGRQRTRAGFEGLLRAAGLEPVGFRALTPELAAIEARPA